MGKGALGQALPHCQCLVLTVGALWVAAVPRGLAARHEESKNSKVFGPTYIGRRHPGNENFDGWPSASR